MKDLCEIPYIDVVKFPVDVLTGVFDSTEEGVTDGGEGGTEDSSELA